MKFIGLRRYAGKTAEQLSKYVSVDLHKSIQDIMTGLRFLSFADNFNCFIEADVSFPAAANASFANRLKTAEVYWIPLRISYDGAGSTMPLIETDLVPITADKITLRNASTQNMTATILVMRK